MCTYQGGNPSDGEDLAVLSLCDHSIIGVRLGFPFFHNWGEMGNWENEQI